MATAKTWYQLTKPGIIYGNAVHFIAGFFLSYQLGGTLVFGLLGLVGTSMLIASACVANNYIDRDIDAHMKRTKKRAIVDGQISGYAALLFAAILAVLAITVLAWAQQWLVALLGAIAYIVYVWVYTYAKRSTIHSTLIGTVPGAIPIAAGYVVNPEFSGLVAVLLFSLLVAWQMPHFYAISLYRRTEYKAAKLPVAGVVSHPAEVGKQMLDWGALYAALTVGLILADGIGILAGLILLVLAISWVWRIWNGRARKYSDSWARSVFGHSLQLSLALVILSVVNLYV